MERYGNPKVVVEFDGIPLDALHYGQWYGSVDGHSISFGLELLSDG